MVGYVHVELLSLTLESRWVLSNLETRDRIIIANFYFYHHQQSTLHANGIHRTKYTIFRLLSLHQVYWTDMKCTGIYTLYE